MGSSLASFPQPATLRTFIAIDLSDAVRAALAGVQRDLQRAVPSRSVRWVQIASIHLTLKFLGDTPSGRIKEVEEALIAAAAEAAPFSFALQGLGCFPDTRRPRVVWVGLSEPAGHLRALWQAVEAHVAPLGWPTEPRGFQPHLTLGRVQQHVQGPGRLAIGQVVESAKIGRLAEMRVRAVSYIKSDLRPTGAVYTTLVEAPLGKPSASGGE